MHSSGMATVIIIRCYSMIILLLYVRTEYQRSSGKHILSTRAPSLPLPLRGPWVENWLLYVDTALHGSSDLSLFVLTPLGTCPYQVDNVLVITNAFHCLQFGEQVCKSMLWSISCDIQNETSTEQTATLRGRVNTNFCVYCTQRYLAVRKTMEAMGTALTKKWDPVSTCVVRVQYSIFWRW